MENVCHRRSQEGHHRNGAFSHFPVVLLCPELTKPCVRAWRASVSCRHSTLNEEAQEASVSRGVNEGQSTKRPHWGTAKAPRCAHFLIYCPSLGFHAALSKGNMLYRMSSSVGTIDQHLTLRDREREQRAVRSAIPPGLFLLTSPILAVAIYRFDLR